MVGDDEIYVIEVVDNEINSKGLIIRKWRSIDKYFSSDSTLQYFPEFILEFGTDGVLCEIRKVVKKMVGRKFSQPLQT